VLVLRSHQASTEGAQVSVRDVVRLMKQDFPKAADWNYIDDDTVEIWDRAGNVIGTITAERLTKYWQASE